MHSTVEQEWWAWVEQAYSWQMLAQSMHRIRWSMSFTIGRCLT